MALKNLIQENVWLDKAKYVDAERIFHERLSKVSEYKSPIICSRDSKSSEKINVITSLNNAVNKLDDLVDVMGRNSHNEETNTKDKGTAKYVLADICESESVKNKKMKKIKVSTLRLRNMNQCENFSLCDQVTKYLKYNDIDKLLSGIKRWDIQVQNQYKSINNCVCLLCYFQTNEFDCWKLHIMSITHLLKCEKTKDLYSYICCNKKCKVLFYGPEKLLNAHRHRHLENGSITGIPILMAEVMKRFMTKKNDPIYFCSDCKKYAEKPIHSNAEKSNTNIKCPVEYYCIYCRVNFYSSPEMIDYHSLSVEHMTLKCFNKLCVEAEIDSEEIKTSKQPNEIKEKSLFGTVENEIITNPVPLPNIVQDILLFKNSDYIEVKNEHLLSVQVSKSKLNDSHDSKSSHNIKHKRYTRYFKHKMDILNLLRQYNDRIMKTLAFYCNVCDFVTQEKYVWDKHTETKHSCAVNEPTVHCSTCSMMIVGATYEEHIRTIEHCNLFEFVQSFEPLVKNTDLLKFVDTSILNETFMDSEQNKSFGFIEINNTEAETLDNLKSVNDCILKNESNSKAKDLTNTYSLSPDKNYDQNKYVKNDEILNPVNCKTTPNKIIDGKSKFDVSLTCDKTALDIVTNLENKFDEDQAYGEYVTRRLKNIKNSSVKQDIQLEIDYLFYTKIKKLLQKNA